MFKRIIWMGTGAMAGAGGAFWAKRKVEQTVERYMPEQVAARVGTSSRELGRTVRAAATEGRQAMRDTEAELRARVDDRTFIGPVRSEPAPVATSELGARGASGRVRSRRRRPYRGSIPTAPVPSRRQARR